MKNRWLKMLSIFLSLVLIFNLLPLQVLASGVDDAPQPSLSVSPDDGSSGSAVTYERLDTLTIVEEDTTRRGEYYKEFVLNNGLRLAAVYAEPVHYEDAGQWRDIDNTLKTTSVKGIVGYTNTAGVWQVYFPQQLSSSNAISLTKDGYTVSFGMAGELTNSGNIAVASIGISNESLAVSSVKSSAAQIRPVDLSSQKAAAQYEQTVLDKQHSKIAYSGIYNNTEVVYDLSGNRLKESIVISKYNASLWGYRYNLNTGGLIPVLLEDNTIELRHPETEAVVMTMPAPFMVDANGEYSFDVDVSLVQKNGSYLLSYYVPRQWLASTDRTWPVVLDPVVQANNVKTNIQDISVTETEVDSNSLDSLRIGYKPGVGTMHAYLRYKALPSLSSSSVIINAKLSMTKLTTSTVGANIEVHKVNTYWQPSDITSWTSKPAFNNTIEDVVFVKDPQVYTWDITNIALNWYSSTTNTLPGNAGLMFKASTDVETGGANNYQRLCSSDGTAIPQLEITYQDTAGLEDYWDYTTVSAGRAGTGYVHNHSGNLVWVHNDMGFDGNRMPVSINHIYNPSLSATNNYGLGYSWQTNYHQTVKAMTDGTYVWTDGDGTPHYFYYAAENTYQDEDNLGLTLALDSDGYTITDKWSNKSKFNSAGQLIALYDNQAALNSVLIMYASGRISQITDGAGRIYTFTYGSDNLLTRIDFKGSAGTTSLFHIVFDYNGLLLTKITYKDGKEAVFTYSSRNYLTSVTDIDGYKLTFTYGATDAGKPKRVTSIAESHKPTDPANSNTVVGGTTQFSYGYMRTVITTPNTTGYSNTTYYFNEWSNTVSVQSDDGKAVFYQYSSVTGSGDTKNQLSASSVQQMAISNLFAESSFEGGNRWTPISGALVSITPDIALEGSKSLEIRGSTAGIGVTSPSFTARGKTSYTFSAYVSSENLGSVRLSIEAGNTVLISESVDDADGWVRLSVTYTNSSTQDVTAQAKIYSVVNDTFYVDCVQLERDVNANRYNLLQDGDFSNGDNVWTEGSGNVVSNSGIAPAANNLDNSYYVLTGDLDEPRRVGQTVAVNIPSGQNLVLAGWARAGSIPLHAYNGNMRTFSIIATVTFSNGRSTSYGIPFTPNNSGQWQFGATEINAIFDITSIRVELAYDYNDGVAYFDGIGLYKENFAEKYKYNNRNNITSSTDILGNTTSYTYMFNSDKISTITYPTGARETYSYHANSFNVSKIQHSIKEEGVYVAQSYIDYSYDDFGNVTGTLTEDLKTHAIQTTLTQYTTDGNYVSTYTNEAGNTTTYQYYADTGLLKSVRYPKDTLATQTNYTYDTMLMVSGISAGTGTGTTMSAGYTYSNDQVATIATPSTTYTMGYGVFGMRTSVQAGGNVLASYTYTDNINRYIKSLYYGEGGDDSTADRIEYTYDEEGRLTQKDYYHCSDGVSAVDSTVKYYYNISGQLARVVDSKTGITQNYFYDTLGRLEKYNEVIGQHGIRYGARFTYDGLGNVVSLRELVNLAEYEYSFIYDSNNQLVRSQSVNLLSPETINPVYHNVSATNRYNKFGAPTGHTVNYNGTDVLTRQIGYINTGTMNILEDGAQVPHSKYSSQVALVLTLTANQSFSYAYTYDGNGNIDTVLGNGETTYEYDSQNQLIRENNQAAGKTWTYEYDDAGNLVWKREYAYTKDEPQNMTNMSFRSYSTTGWGDLMTAYNGRTVTHDDIGNLLDDGSRTYTWQEGRQLATLTQGNVTWTYTYDDSGLRTQRTSGSKNYTYIYRDGKLRGMSDGTNTMFFEYDASGHPMTITYNGTAYLYVTNLQGDVMAIVTTAGATVVSYVYDAWGYIYSTTGSMATSLGQHNPLRYRGYVYDQETGLYYLQSRYYNPEWGRFINADNQIDADNPLGLNLFAYCGNNPVNRVDPTGEAWWHWALGAAVAVAAAAATVVTLGAFAPAAACTLTLMATSMGVSYATASTIATVAVAATTYAASMYVADAAFTSVTGSSFMLDTVFQGNVEAYNAGRQLVAIATFGMVDMAAMSPGVCFVAGTLVKAENGNAPIEQIQVGDLVWAWDEETGDVALKRVVETYLNQSDELIHVFINGEEIVTTPEHPFYSPVKGWTAACKLRAGDILVLVNGEYVVVEKIQHEILEAPIAVYNFQVADYHTYYVADSGVLVHNSCDRGVGGKGWVGDKTWRENVATVGNGGTITSLNGGIPTEAQARQLISQSGGGSIRVEPGHLYPNPHTYPHINYVTSNGTKGTIRIFE